MRQIFANKLSDVIHMLQLARKTGQLSVEHIVEGGLFEQGTLLFVNGQITQASTGASQGASALAKLQTWEGCHFAFCLSDASSQETSKQNNGTHKGPSALPPYRLQESDRPRFSRMGLSRVHWHLFLLVDGQRSVSQLARLLGRSMQETGTLLFELERAHLIQR
ncbi:MAG: DUF4388 domain-containing protein [Chloroflexota bacterium]|nr:DUF4388 domain-containing protein [Chloroflexota bacterium]